MAIKSTDILFQIIRKDKNQGSILIAVLWVVMTASIMMLSLSFEAHLQARISSYHKKKIQAEYLAKSGIAIAELLLEKSSLIRKKSIAEEEIEEKWWYLYAKKLSLGAGVYNITNCLGNGIIKVDIIPEPARRNINRLTVDDWERILLWAGIPEESWPDLIDSFLDWTDVDNIPRRNGAETEDYYSKLPFPYCAKNGPLDTIYELLLIKGFTNIYLDGGEIYTGKENLIKIRGIRNILTTFGDGLVNVNAASEDVLLTLPYIDEITAAIIIQERGDKVPSDKKIEPSPFISVDDFFRRIPEIDPRLKKYITTESTIFRINSTGIVGNVEKRISCIVRYDGSKISRVMYGKPLIILMWEET